MSDEVPVWVWLPGADTPVEAGGLRFQQGEYRFAYRHKYKGNPALDPVQLRIKAGNAVSQTLPGVFQDAKPAGYGEDRLNAKWQAEYQRDLTDLELLELGPADSVGAIEVCEDIQRKLQWRPTPVEALGEELARLEDDAPASRAMRRANQDEGTSAGGERPKATFSFMDKMWLVKMQDRGDRQGMPAMEYTTMRLAALAEITAAPVELKSVGRHQALMVERFDRIGALDKPQRRLFASAHTVLQLPAAATRGDHPGRSYLALADRMRVWCRQSPTLEMDLQELWKRMAFNALVGNTDDHPRNHGLLNDKGGWHLAPAFDITPIWMPPSQGQGASMPSLAMATGEGTSGDVEPSRLLESAPHFGLKPEDAASYLGRASKLIVEHWEKMMRDALEPIVSQREPGYRDKVIDQCRQSFSISQRLVEDSSALEKAIETVMAPKRVGRPRRKG